MNKRIKTKSCSFKLSFASENNLMMDSYRVLLAFLLIGIVAVSALENDKHVESK